MEFGPTAACTKIVSKNEKKNIIRNVKSIINCQPMYQKAYFAGIEPADVVAPVVNVVDAPAVANALAAVDTDAADSDSNIRVFV